MSNQQFKHKASIISCLKKKLQVVVVAISSKFGENLLVPIWWSDH
jgi:hypothetical protein